MEIDIQSSLRTYLESKRKVYPQHVNRVSSLDDPCLRRMYYRRAAWDKASPHPTSLLGVFETGNVLEPVIERIVSEVGQASDPRWRIVGAQMPTNDKFLRSYQIAGSIDGFLQLYVDDRWVTVGVLDTKTMSPNIYPRINCYDDLGRYPWTRSYRGQLMTYAFAHNLEHCYLLCVNKGNLYDMKLIHFPIDMDYLERLIQRAQAVNEAVETGAPPEGIDEPTTCERCQWLSYCCPQLVPTGNLKILEDGELEAVLDRMGDLSTAANEYRDLEKQRDGMLVKGQAVAAGVWLITWKQASNEVWRKKVFRRPAPELKGGE